MPLLSPWPPLLCLLLALAATSLLARRFPVHLPPGRISTLDGLRGYLAFAVFCHHAAIWAGVLRNIPWTEPPSNLYLQLGQSSVALFFMITAFLFTSRILRNPGEDWLRFYISRILRLVPLYYLTVFAMCLIVAAGSHWTLRVRPASLASQAATWLLFETSFLNDFDAPVVVAGATWTLAFEWVFYLSLPLLALLLRRPPPLAALLMPLIAAVYAFNLPYPAEKALPFAGGIVAAFLARRPAFSSLASHPGSAFLVIAPVAAVFTFPAVGSGLPRLALLTLAFSLIAAGNTLGGILSAPLSRIFGEFTYSTYLIHGLLLFVTFRAFPALARAATASPLAHWAIIASLTPILITAAFFSFRFIESPALRSAPALTAWLRALPRRSA